MTIVRINHINFSLVNKLSWLKRTFEILSVIFIILDLVLYLLINILDIMTSMIIENKLAIEIILVLILY